MASTLSLKTAIHSLHFGECVDGRPEYVVTYDMFGLHPYAYDDVRDVYIPRLPEKLWQIPAIGCSNPEVLALLPLPDTIDLDRYSLGYVSMLLVHPELAEYADNPGVLALLIAHLDHALELVSQNLPRAALVKALVGIEPVQKFHIGWLKKIRPGTEQPAVIAATLTASLLRVPAHDLRKDGSTYVAKRYKLFAHQQQWTLRGLEFAKTLLRRDDLALDDFGYLMDGFNGNEPKILPKARAALLEFGSTDYAVTCRARLRARLIARHQDYLTLRFAQKFGRVVFQTDSESDFVDFCAMFLTDDDIPSPAVRGNRRVQALDTLAKLRSHAKRAKNCVWSLEILSRIIMREMDVYVVQGVQSYTVSLDRRSFEIRQLEPFSAATIHPADLELIADWFKESTVMPR